jgi:replicative DNA helicase
VSTPPHNLDAEENVLGAMLLSEGAVEDVLETGLSPTDFFREGSHGVIYQTMTRLHDEGHPVDHITVQHRLEQAGKLAAVGGNSRLAELGGLVTATSNVAHWANIVKDTSTLRALINAGMQITKLGQEGGDIPLLVDQAENLLTKVTLKSTPDDFAAVSDGLTELMGEIEEAIEQDRPRFGLRTGYTELDDVLSGLHPGQLILIAARPSMGKSALAQNIAENVADKQTAAAFASLEMSKTDIQIRSLSRLCKISSKLIRTGTLPISDITRLREGATKLRAREQHLFIDANPLVTIPQLRARVKRLKRQSSLGLVVVDYLQLMVGSAREESVQAEIAQISRSLKVLAMELQIPIIALSQLNRKLESRPDKRPILSDLRDSGALEQDADVVLFLYRDDYYNPMADVGVAEVIVAKNRNGETQKTVKLVFSKTYTTFHNPLEEKE